MSSNGNGNGDAPHIAAALAWLRSSDPAERAEAVAQLLLAFEARIQTLAAWYAQPVIGGEQEDLAQVARMGLVEACQTFDREKGAFPTHAMWQMRRALADYVGSLENPVRLPKTLTFRLSKMRRVAVQLTQQLHRLPTLEELSAAVARKPEQIAAMLMYDRGPVALDEECTCDMGRAFKSHPQREHFSTGRSPEDELIEREEAEAAQRRRRKE